MKMKLKYQRWVNTNLEDLTGKRYLITGANSGIGFYASAYLASKGASVVMACRNIAKAEIAKREILRLFPKAVLDIIAYDQASFASIDHAAEEIIGRYHSLDGIVLNAGIFHPKSGEKTKDGYSLTIGTNFLGCYYFVEKMKNYLLKLEKPRIVFVTSLVYKTRKRLTRTMFIDGLKGRMSEYALSKKLIVQSACHLAVHNAKIHVEIVHPGVASTNIYSSTNTSFPKWFMSLAHKLLPLFTQNPQKASLVILKGLVAERRVNLGIHGPRGLLEVSGYPKLRKIKARIIKDNEKVMREVQDLLESEKV